MDEKQKFLEFFNGMAPEEVTNRPLVKLSDYKESQIQQSRGLKYIIPTRLHYTLCLAP